ncbi:aminodeoxychorismate synthase component I [Wenzhouxiangella sp. XN24]|uniref:aminodeoxychorismate synthase component I n=1 Tax=Wenzhouxiangella sp. XN24 TaxID=2713569 RepID=UPI003211E7E7
MAARSPAPELLVGALADPGDLLALHRVAPQRYPFLLESAAAGTPQGQCDLLLGAPGDALVLDERGALSGPEAAGDHDFLAALDRWWRAEQCGSDDPWPLAAGGWFVYLGYELAGQVEPGLRLDPPRGLPIAFAVRVGVAVLRDRQTGRCRYMCEDADSLERLHQDLDIARKLPPPDWAGLAGAAIEAPPEMFLSAVRRAREYIIAGDIFQANLSREWRAPLRPDADPAALYERLRTSNPGPFAGLARWGDQAVLSSSPERLLSLRDGVAQTRPIAGTRPRGADAAGDVALEQELIGHPKERAEHVMLIDLERNDLGRICRPGSIEVDQMMVLETYAHVHHIVSNVRGLLADDIGPGTAIRAVFPGGTITGCPKVRCMEIIQELEAGPRGAYTGSMGWLARDGSMDLNILIRTMEMGPDEVRFRAGAGIVFDSTPEAELAETRAKAKGMLLALGAGA